MKKTFKGAAKRLDDADLPRIGATIGVGEDEIHAFMEVEAAGSGFDKQGRPKMLFEPHVFYRNLSGKQRDTAVKSGLAYAKWKPGKYPADSYPRLLKAMEIDETAALKAASWGAGQILGENHLAAGFKTPQDMVAAFMDDEEAHVAAIVNFLSTKGLAEKLRAHDWAGVARGYNGAGYKQNGYDRKMAAAFAKWSKIRDTPYKPAEPKNEPRSQPNEFDSILHRGSRGQFVTELQQNLNTLGDGPVKVDGVFGKETEAAVVQFQHDAGLKPDGWAGPRTLEAIGKAIKDRETAPKIAAAKDVVDDAASKGPISKTEVAAGVVAVSGAAKAADEVKNAVDSARGLTESLWSLGPWVLVGLLTVAAGIYIYYDRRRKRLAANAAKAVM